ncbi:hypothetical protein OQA88_13671 [Cercophora sp. LCS_1]
MWLINNLTKQLEFIQNPKRGSYAILSHTWGDEEITFQQCQDGRIPTGRAGQGIEKVLKTCELALARDLQYSWVDTCCIDKLSSAELSEAINSMFKWYLDAAVCFVYLSDVRPSEGFDRAFAASRWLKRGWTLQELIAPRHVEFYDASWNKRSSKAESIDFLLNCTGIDREVLENSANLSRIPVARRMSWASMRETTRVEDTAYCLMGIFDIHMPMIYGEGAKAFMRLEEEIAKQSCDLSLFAWTRVLDDDIAGDSPPENFRGLFARSPREFYHSGTITRGQMGGLMERDFSITNKGVRMETALVRSVLAGGDGILNLNVRQKPQATITQTRGWIGVYLAKTPLGYVRCQAHRLYTAGEDRRSVDKKTEIYIRKDIDAADQLALSTRFLRSIHLRGKPQGSSLPEVMPMALWDPMRRLFINQAWGINVYACYKFPCCGEETVQVVVGCSTIEKPVCRVWASGEKVFAQIMEHMRHRTELSDYVSVDYFRHYFCRGLEVDSSSISFFCKHRDRRFTVQAKLVTDEYEGMEAYFLDVSSAVQQLR